MDSETWFQKVDTSTSVRMTRSAADPLNFNTQAARLEIRRHFFSNRVVEGWNLIPSVRYYPPGALIRISIQNIEYRSKLADMRVISNTDLFLKKVLQGVAKPC